MYSNELQELILRALVAGPRNHYDLAAALDQAPFRIRAELKTLKRERLVSDVIDEQQIVWSLTGKAVSKLNQGAQLTLGVQS
jgi:predicted transcriptional regulator